MRDDSATQHNGELQRIYPVEKCSQATTLNRCQIGKDNYATHRRIYRFGWANQTVFDSQAIHTEIISDAVSAVAVVGGDNRQISVSEIDEHTDPFRYSEHLLIDQSDMDCLMYRTERYSKAYLAHLREDYYDELAS